MVLGCRHCEANFLLDEAERRANMKDCFLVPPRNDDLFCRDLLIIAKSKIYLKKTELNLIICSSPSKM
jgi:hypothetical protein